MEINITQEKIDFDAEGYLFTILERNRNFEPEVNFKDVSFILASRQLYKVLLETYVAIVSHAWCVDGNEEELLHAPKSLVKFLMSVYRLAGIEINDLEKEKWDSLANSGDKYYLVMFEKDRMYPNFNI